MHRTLSITLCIMLAITLLLSNFSQINAQSSAPTTGLFNLILLKKLLIAQRPRSTTQQKTLPSISPTPQQTVLGTQQSTNQTRIIQEINKYRESQGLSSVQINDETCSFAKTRAQEISQQFSHEGFRTRIDEKKLPYQTWTQATENIAMTTDPTEVVTLWINSSGHAENMRKNTPFVCVEQYGDYFAYEGMRP